MFDHDELNEDSVFSHMKLNQSSLMMHESQQKELKYVPSNDSAMNPTSWWTFQPSREKLDSIDKEKQER